MNTETGKVSHITAAQLRELRPDGKPRYIPVQRSADPNCKRCHGTGSRRRGTKARGMFVPCRCVL